MRLPAWNELRKTLGITRRYTVDQIPGLDPDEAIHVADTTTDDDILEVLSRHTRTEVRQAAASNPHMPVTALIALAFDLDTRVRAEVGENPATPVETMDHLANDASPQVRAGVAMNPHASTDTLGRLALDVEMWVRGAVARNDDAPSVVITILREDEDDWVRQCAIDHPATPESVRHHHYAQILGLHPDDARVLDLAGALQSEDWHELITDPGQVDEVLGCLEAYYEREARRGRPLVEEVHDWVAA